MVRTRSGARALCVRVKSVETFRVLTRKVDVSSDDVARMAEVARSGSCIFNPNKRRYQREIEHSEGVVQRVLELLGEEGMLEGRTVGPVVSLHSLAGCEQQQFHTDYDKHLVRKAEAKPLGVLVALEDETSLVLQDRVVLLGAGDVLVFDGDLVHAGAAYEHGNTRLHLYLDVPCVHRAHNTTYFCDE